MPFALSFWRLGGGLKVRSPLIRAKCVAPHEYSFMCRTFDEADLVALAKLGRQLTGTQMEDRGPEEAAVLLQPEVGRDDGTGRAVGIMEGAGREHPEIGDDYYDGSQ